MQKFDPTTPAGRPLLSVDFSRLLPPSVTIASASVTIQVHALSAADDGNAAARLDGAPILSADHTTISQWFIGGVEEVDYVLTFIATFSDGQIEPVEVEMPVRRYI
jgi:hypothetical protein